MPEMDDKRLHEEIIGRKEVFRGALVRVEHWDARLASGRTALREIVKNYNAAAIVPVDADDRLWREMTGDACQYLAARAGTVFRVVCGIPVLLKGGEQ